MIRGDREAEAAAVLRRCHAAFAADGVGVIREAVGDAAGEIIDWRHYPEGEAYDPLTHVQYFFHRHRAAGHSSLQGSGGEDGGHFHLFLRGDGMPAGVTPLILAENAVAGTLMPPQSAPLKRGNRDEVSHLVAIAVDRCGRPVRLFTTNRWVTGETWYCADDVIAMLDRVRLRSRPPALLDRWIEALICLFQPEIAALLRQRDKTIMDWRWRRPRVNVFEDPRLEIISIRDIDLEARLKMVEAGTGAPVPAAAATRRSLQLPSLAEGWGA